MIRLLNTSSRPSEVTASSTMLGYLRSLETALALRNCATLRRRLGNRCMSLKLAQAIYLRTSSGGFAIFAAIRRASLAIPAVSLVIGIRRRNTNTPTVAAIKRPQRGSHACVVALVVVVTVDRARFGRSLRSSSCTRGFFSHWRSKLTTWNGAWR
jgi:hypothetical protein